jgi:signal transduction histidine kinase/integral membrane sensor domain MASE1
VTRPNLLLKRSLLFIAVSSAYFLLGWSGLELATINNNTSPFWPSSGLAMGCLILFGNWLAPAIFIGAFLINMTVGTPLLGLVGISTGNMLEAVVGAQLIVWLLRRYHDNAYAEFYAIIIGGALAALVSASIGVSTLYLLDAIHADQILYSWYTWISGDSVGILVVLPLFLEIYLGKKEDRQVTPRKIFEAIILVLLLGSCSWIVFTQSLNQAMSWVLTPIFILAGLRLGQLLSRCVLILISILIVYLTLKGYSPFELGNLNLNFIHVQSLLASYAFGILFVRPFSTQFKISRKFIIGNIFGWTSVFLVIYAMCETERNFLMQDFNKTVDSAIETLEETSQKYELMLINATSLFLMKPELTKKNWQEYVDSLELPVNYKGVYGLGFTARVEKKKVSQWQMMMLKRGVSEAYFKIIDEEYSALFPDRYVISYVEPYDSNFVAVGLDIGSEKNRRETADKAYRHKKVFATHPLQLIQDDVKRPSFLILYPVDNGSSSGWIYAPVISQLFFTQALLQYSHLLQTSIEVDGKTIFGNKSLKDFDARRKIFQIKRKITLFNLNHEASIFPTNDFFIRHSANTGGLALLMNLFMLFITGFLLEQITFGQRSEKLVTERTTELEASKEQLIQSSKMATLGRMASGVAHEINNPLAIIMMKIKVISVMLEELKVRDPKIKDEIEKITITTHRIENIVKGLKSFSRVSKDDPFEAVSLKVVVQETLELCQDRFKIHRIQLRLEPIPDVFILTRPSQMAQVLLNLLNNSIDAIEKQDQKWIELNFVELTSKIKIIITDSGNGISKEIASKIMDPFYTTKEVGRGTGLGLSIAKGIVEDHGGRLWLDDQCANTRFVIEMPKHLVQSGES